jgi:hypothetical protein
VLLNFPPLIRAKARSLPSAGSLSVASDPAEHIAGRGFVEGLEFDDIGAGLGRGLYEIKGRFNRA